MFHKLRQRDPSSCVHVKVTLVLNELLVDRIGLYTLGAKSS